MTDVETTGAEMTDGAIVAATGADAMMKASKRRRTWHELHAIRRRRAPPVLPPPQKLSVLGLQCTQDRLQGRKASTALHLREWQGRAEPHHRGVGKEAARTRARHQTRALSRTAALCDPLGWRTRRVDDSCGERASNRDNQVAGSDSRGSESRSGADSWGAGLRL